MSDLPTTPPPVAAEPSAVAEASVSPPVVDAAAAAAASAPASALPAEPSPAATAATSAPAASSAPAAAVAPAAAATAASAAASAAASLLTPAVYPADFRLTVCNSSVFDDPNTKKTVGVYQIALFKPSGNTMFDDALSVRWKRYTEFVALNEEVKTFQIGVLPDLPSKWALKSTSEGVLRSRLIQLNAYMKAVADQFHFSSNDELRTVIYNWLDEDVGLGAGEHVTALAAREEARKNNEALMGMKLPKPLKPLPRALSASASAPEQPQPTALQHADRELEI